MTLSDIAKKVMRTRVNDADFSDWESRYVWDQRIQVQQFVTIEETNDLLALIDPKDIVSVIPFSMGSDGERYLVSYRQHRLHKNFHAGGRG